MSENIDEVCGLCGNEGDCPVCDKSYSPKAEKTLEEIYALGTIFSIIGGHTLKECEAMRHRAGLQAVSNADTALLKKRIANLEAWKEDAISVMPPYQEIAQEIELRIGSSTHDKILPALIRRRQQITALEQVIKRLAEENGNLRVALEYARPIVFAKCGSPNPVSVALAK